MNGILCSPNKLTSRFDALKQTKNNTRYHERKETANLPERIPGHALHEKGSQKTKKLRSTVQQPGTKTASRPGDKPQMNCRCSTGQLQVNSGFLFFHRFTWDFACSCFLGDVQTGCLRCFGGYEGGLSPRRTVLLASSPARPSLANPPCAPTRFASGMSGFWTRQVMFFSLHLVQFVGGICKNHVNWPAFGCFFCCFVVRNSACLAHCLPM